MVSARSIRVLGSPSPMRRSAIRPAAEMSARALLTRAAVSSRAQDLGVGDLGAHRDLRLGLGLADRAEHVGDLDRPGSARPSWAIRATSSTVGHGARCTEPSCHHDQTSSVTNGRNGANSRSCTLSAVASAARAEAAASGPWAAVGPVLDQLEVVVAERPEVGLGQLEGAGVVVVLERRGGLGDDLGQGGQLGAVERVR